jgi:hypothetical protein
MGFSIVAYHFFSVVLLVLVISFVTGHVIQSSNEASTRTERDQLHVDVALSREVDTPYNERTLQQQSTITIKVQSSTVKLFQLINVTIGSNINRQTHDKNLRLILSSQISSVTTTAKDYLDHSGKSVYGLYSGNSTTVSLAIDYTKLIGKTFDPVYYKDDYDYYVLRKTSFNTTTDVKTWNNNNSNNTYLIVLLDTTNTKVISTSNPFSITGDDSNDITVKLSRNLYFGGQTIQITTSVGSSYVPNDKDYFAIFRIPESLKNASNTPSKFNNSTLVYKHSNIVRPTINNPLLTNITIESGNMSIPAFYQIVLFAQYGQLVRMVSTIYQIGNPSLMTKTIISMDSNITIFPGQSFNISISKLIGTPYDSRFTIGFVRSNTTVPSILNSPFEEGDPFRSRYTFVWDSVSTTINLTLPFDYIQYGLYRFHLYVGVDNAKRYASSPYFVRIRRPLWNISLPKRVYKIGETISINPTTDLYDPYAAYKTVTRNYPLSLSFISANPNETTINYGPYFQPTSPGLYRVAVVSQHMFWFSGSSYDQYEEIILEPIRNTTFRFVA